MRWHKEARVNDDVLGYPDDGEAWKEFEKIYPDYVAQPRNVRSVLASNGFNLYENFSSEYST